MKTSFSESTDGRCLIAVEAPKWSPDADAPTVRLTFHLRMPEGWTVKAGTSAIILLSCVRVDTMEAIALDKDQMTAMTDAAIKAAAEFDPDW